MHFFSSYASFPFLTFSHWRWTCLDIDFETATSRFIIDNKSYNFGNYLYFKCQHWYRGGGGPLDRLAGCAPGLFVSTLKTKSLQMQMRVPISFWSRNNTFNSEWLRYILNEHVPEFSDPEVVWDTPVTAYIAQRRTEKLHGIQTIPNRNNEL